MLTNVEVKVSGHGSLRTVVYASEQHRSQSIKAGPLRTLAESSGAV